MSLQMDWNTEIPYDTAQVGREILAEDDPYRLVGEGVNDFLSTKDFASMYSKLGREVTSPIMLRLITVFQFLENIPDRTAARWATTRLEWSQQFDLSWILKPNKPSVLKARRRWRGTSAHSLMTTLKINRCVGRHGMPPYLDIFILNGAPTGACSLCRN